MKKIKLKTKNNVPDKIIGISSLHNDFQVAWSINKLLKINLTKTKDFIYTNNINFSIFKYIDSEENTYYLLSNKSKGSILSSKFKNIDFFFILKTSNLNIEELSSSINNSNFINGSFLLLVETNLKRILSYPQFSEIG